MKLPDNFNIINDKNYIIRHGDLFNLGFGGWQQCGPSIGKSIAECDKVWNNSTFATRYNKFPTEKHYPFGY